MKDYTEGTEELKHRRAKKMMLWFGMVSLGMSFAGFTSAYIVSKNRRDWLQDLELPQAFYWSLIVIVLSSVTMHFAKKLVQKEQSGTGMALLCATFALGVLFIWFQFQGFVQMINDLGVNFTGKTSNIKGSFIYIIAVVHIAHVVAGLIALLVVIYNHFKQKYKNGKTLGIELAATFWHFIDFLWVYLFLFFYFVR
ncbi:cytochrome c oxidase subunit 3 [Aureisphaera galaxeae]|uniref:cytochrome c oxidase subunit 3 n=1 Tax=Aureisphaera galaxeae TaxID=1538023 RepID=UPI0023501EDE|nr:cytochrome c oxidase subunit 3 [Aureisphaera galaxeae]MDC8005796.1 cytochrome c oxidase subunit 3 [Aureisphaera galaxeae]